jgi:hypothetical protein
MKYMGLQLGASFKAKSIWEGIIEKMKRCLAGWKRLYSSKGGRITLIKITLSNLPTYLLSIFLILVGVANRIEKLQHSCGVESVIEFKFHLVSWSKTCTATS